MANKGCHCTGCWGCSFFTSVVCLGSICLPFILDNYLFFIITGVAYLIHLIVLCCSDTFKFLNNLDLDINPYKLTHKLQHTNPMTVWHIECYHYETRFRTVTTRDANGNTQTRTETYQEKVTTHRNTHNQRYREVEDASPILSGLEQFRMTRIYNKLDLAFANAEISHYFHQLRRDWIHFNDRDRHYSFSEKHVLPGMKGHVLAFNGKKKDFPCCLNTGAFCLLGFLTLDWILMFYMMRYSARLNYKFIKVVHQI